jgi:hypothetical protein
LFQGPDLPSSRISGMENVLEDDVLK